jgi:glutamine amidotransferase
MIGIINYGAGNIFSLQCALDRIGASYALVQDPVTFDQYEKYIIPGVGNAKPAMEKLLNTGLVPLLKTTKKPLLGVCLGMQLITSHSEEGDVDLLNLIPLSTKRFVSDNVKVPQMGWNTVDLKKNQNGLNPLFEGIKNNDFFYFVHSYYVALDAGYTIGSCEYVLEFSAAIQKENFYGVQFHPEKSGMAGERLLQNFMNLPLNY